MNCSIVIRAYNEEKHIERLLEGIRWQTIRDVEIILVDSGSTDVTVHLAESFGARAVHILSAEACVVEKSFLDILVPLHAIPRHTDGLPRVGAAHAAITRDVLLCT
jgi:hypothetical protein